MILDASINISSKKWYPLIGFYPCKDLWAYSPPVFLWAENVTISLKQEWEWNEAFYVAWD